MVERENSIRRMRIRRSIRSSRGGTPANSREPERERESHTHTEKCVCVCVCVCERERERARGGVGDIAVASHGGALLHLSAAVRRSSVLHRLRSLRGASPTHAHTMLFPAAFLWQRAGRGPTTLGLGVVPRQVRQRAPGRCGLHREVRLQTMRGSNRQANPTPRYPGPPPFPSPTLRHRNSSRGDACGPCADLCSVLGGQPLPQASCRPKPKAPRPVLRRARGVHTPN